MPVLREDFSKIAMDFEPVPAQVYRSKIVEIESVEEDKAKGVLPQINFEWEVQEGEFKGRKLFDYCYLKTKKGERNDMGMGRIRANAAAILGEEAAAGNSIDTDALKGGVADLVVSVETYTKKPEKGGGEGKRNKIDRVLPAK